MSAIDQKIVAARSRVAHLETELAAAKAVLDTLEDLVPVSFSLPDIEEAKKRADRPLSNPVVRAVDTSDLDAFFAGIPNPTSAEEARRWAIEKYQRDLVFYGLGWSDKDNAAFSTKNLRALLGKMTPETRLQFYDKLPKERAPRRRHEIGGAGTDSRGYRGGIDDPR